MFDSKPKKTITCTGYIYEIINPNQYSIKDSVTLRIVVTLGVAEKLRLGKIEIQQEER